MTSASQKENGEIMSDKKKKIFVIQEHYATHHHFDFRLEVDGVLKSWAVPKEPPKEEGIKRLAIQTQDHAMEYADFEGIIPEGRYGAGTVKIWDKGTFTLQKIEDKEIIFSLDGKKMKGEFVLVKTKFGKGNSWLFFKKMD